MSENTELTDRVICFTLPLKNGNHSYFSGYLIATGLYITCRHGFETSTDYDDKKPLSIVSGSESIIENVPLDNRKTFDALMKSSLIKFESKKYDVVLFEYGKAKALFQDLYPKQITPRNGEFLQWYGGGFPFYGGGTKNKSYKDLNGEIKSVANNPNFVDIVEETALKEASHWKEASGSPVFISNTKQLAAILCEIPTYKDSSGKDRVINKQLVAIQLHKLWNDKDQDEAKFKQILEGLKPNQHKINQNKLKEFIKANDNADLRNKLYSAFDVPSSQQETLIQTILNASAQKVSTACESIKEISGIKEIKGIKEFLQLAMCCQYANKSWILDTPTDDKPFVESPHVYLEAIEYAHAGKNAREPILTMSADGNKIHSGKYHLNSPPFAGMKSDYASAIENDVTAGNGDLNNVTNRLFEEYGSRKSINSEERKKELARKVLKEEHYLTLENDPNQAEQVTKNLKKVFKEYPMITTIFIATDDDGRIEDQEKQIFEPLKDFYL